MGGDQLRGSNQPGHRAAEAADHVNSHLNAVHIDAGQLGGAFITPHSVDLTPEWRLTRDKCAHTREKDHDPDDNGNPQNISGAKNRKTRISKFWVAHEVREGSPVVAELRHTSRHVENSKCREEGCHSE